MSVHLKTVNFGAANAGLSTVGYTLYNNDGSVNKSRSTSNVFEIGTSTGNYACPINFPDKEEVILLWDTGGATPRYATDESMVQMNSIQEETDRIRAIWNSLKNIGETYAKLIDKINKLDKTDNKKDFEAILKEIKKIIIPEIPTLADIKDALNVTVNPPLVPAPVVNIPKVIIPDYTNRIFELKLLLSDINTALKKIPTAHKDYTGHLTEVINKMTVLNKDIISNLENKHKEVSKTNDVKSNIGNLVFEMNNLKKELSALNTNVHAVNTNISETMKPSKFLQDIYQILEQANDLKKITDDYQKKMNSLKLAGIG